MSEDTDPSRRDESQRAGFAAVLVATIMIGQQVASRAIRDGFFLTYFEATALPSVMIGASLLSVAIVLGSAPLLRRVPPARCLPIFLGGNTALFVAEWALSGPSPHAAAVILYLHTTSIGAVVLSVFWSVVNERFDPFTAKQLVGRIGSGASLGGLLGGLAAWGGASVMDVPSMVLVMAILSGSCIVFARGIGGSTTAPKDGGLRISAIEILQETPYLRHMAALVGLLAFAEAAFDYVFKATAAEYFSGGQELVSFFALFYLALGIGTLAVQNLFTRRSLMLMGLAFTISTLPAVIVGLGLIVLFVPSIATATTMRGGLSVIGNSLYSSGYELLYTPVVVEKKRPIKTLLDVGGDKLGTAIGAGFAFFILGIFPSFADSILVGLGIVAGIAALGITRWLHRGYVSSLEESLRSGSLDAESLEAVDATTRETVEHTMVDIARGSSSRTGESPRLGRAALLERISRRRSPTPPIPRQPLAAPDRVSIDTNELDDTVSAMLDLRSRDPARVRRALAENTPIPRELVVHAVELLDNPSLAGNVATALRRVAPVHTGLFLDVALQSRTPLRARCELVDLLGNLPTQRSADGLVDLLAVDSFELRFHAAASLLRIRQQRPSLDVSAARILELAEREAEDVRRRWRYMTVIDGQLTHGDLTESNEGKRTLRGIAFVFTLLLIVLDREPLQLALRAVTVEGEGQRGTGLEYLDNVLPAGLKNALWPLLEDRRFASWAVRERSEILGDILDEERPKEIDLAGLRERIDALRRARSAGVGIRDQQES